NQSAVSDPDNDYMAGFLYIDTSYGKSVDMRLFSGDYTATESMRPYIGSDSLVPYSWDGDNGGWIAQDPPKISTLVDPLTDNPGSNPNWTVSGTVTQVTSGIEGGGYRHSSSSLMTSVDTYDLIGSEFTIEFPAHEVVLTAAGALVGAI